MHITNQKLSFNGTLSLLNILMIFGIKEKSIHFDTNNVFLAIAINIPVLLMTSFVVQGHILLYFFLMCFKGTQNAVFPDHFYENSNGACGIRNVGFAEQKKKIFLQLRNGFIKNVAKNASVGIKLNSCHDNLPLTTLCVCHEGR